MISTPTRSYTTSDLRRAEVLDEAFIRPVSVRDGKTGNMMLMVPQELIDRINNVSDYAQLLGRVIIECQRADPSTAVLGPTAYISGWNPERQAHFVRGFAEAVVKGAADNNPGAIAAYIEVMSHADDALLPQFDSGRGSRADRERVERHIAQRSLRSATEADQH